MANFDCSCVVQCLTVALGWDQWTYPPPPPKLYLFAGEQGGLTVFCCCPILHGVVLAADWEEVACSKQPYLFVCKDGLVGLLQRHHPILSDFVLPWAWWLSCCLGSHSTGPWSDSPRLLNFADSFQPEICALLQEIYLKTPDKHRDNNHIIQS